MPFVSSVLSRKLDILLTEGKEQEELKGKNMEYNFEKCFYALPFP